MKEKINIYWFRRDLRFEDNHGLYQALKSEYPVLPIFIFDPEILQQFEDKKDRRVDYIHQVLKSLHQELQKQGSGFRFFHQKTANCFQDLMEQFDIQEVYCNTDYEPYALKRDAEVQTLLESKQISFRSYKDQVVFEANEILKADKSPYTIFTPYSKKWLGKIQLTDYLPFASEGLKHRFLDQHPISIPNLIDLGFETTDIVYQKPDLSKVKISDFDAVREFPCLDATSHLGIALRFGTISIRACIPLGLHTNATWLKALIWRDFFMQILYNFPKVVSASFKSKYDYIDWRNNEEEFKKWCLGQTGYPLVDAGMRQLNATGQMHNRVRMVVASFLTKHLLIDWRWGEAYFAQKLLDFDLAANNGNWQWAAGTGCDAAPYFRIFNPETQLVKFDPKYLYVKKWISEWDSPKYSAPIVEHKIARERALDAYKKALKRDL